MEDFWLICVNQASPSCLLLYTFVVGIRQLLEYERVFEYTVKSRVQQISRNSAQRCIFEQHFLLSSYMIFRRIWPPCHKLIVNYFWHSSSEFQLVSELFFCEYSWLFIVVSLGSFFSNSEMCCAARSVCTLLKWL